MNASMMAELAKKRAGGLKSVQTNDRSAAAVPKASEFSTAALMAAMPEPPAEEPVDSMAAFRQALTGALRAKAANPEDRVAIFDKYSAALACLEDFELVLRSGA